MFKSKYAIGIAFAFILESVTCPHNNNASKMFNRQIYLNLTEIRKAFPNSDPVYKKQINKCELLFAAFTEFVPVVHL